MTNIIKYKKPSNSEAYGTIFCRTIMKAKHVNNFLFGTFKVSIKSCGWLFVNHAIESNFVCASL
jgi:hypothetical protein